MDEVIMRCIMGHPLTYADVAQGICPDDACEAPFIHGPESAEFIVGGTDEA